MKTSKTTTVKVNADDALVLAMALEYARKEARGLFTERDRRMLSKTQSQLDRFVKNNN